MRRKLLFTYLMFCCNVMAIAQQTKLSCVTNNLHVGDSIRYDLVDIENLCIPGYDKTTWDFSNLKYLGQEREVFFCGEDTTEIRMIGQNEMSDFKQTTASLRLLQIQTPLLKIDFGYSFSYLNYPFSATDSVACNLDGKGVYCSRNKFRLLGKCMTKAIGEGKIILPSNDSLPNTLLIQRSVRGDIFLSKDSVEPDNQVARLLLKVATNEWYSQGYRYPVFKTLQATLWNGKRAIMRRQQAYTANMESFANLMDDYGNSQYGYRWQAIGVRILS